MFVIARIAAVVLCLVPAARDDWAYKAEDGPHKVKAVEKILLHDKARDKDLQVRVTYPDGDGPFPVIVWSHGATGTKDHYRPLVQHWATHGYVSIQPNHSDSRALTGKAGPGPDTFRDWQNRPKDIAFLLDSLDEIEKKVPALKGKLDRKKIGAGGHSFGAHTTQMIAGATTKDLGGNRESHADKRPLAFLLLSPQGVGTQSAGLDEKSWDGVTRPFIVITGTMDFGRKGDDWTWRLHPYEYAPPEDKFLLVIQGAYHGFGGLVDDGTGFRGKGPDNPDHRKYVKSAAIAFWDAYLKKDEKAAAFLRSDTMERKSKREAKLSCKEKKKPRKKHTEVFEDVTWKDKERDRDVPVRIYAPKEAKDKLPVIVFSHGGGESRDAFTYLGEHLAQNGYLAVFLTHKGNDRESLGGKGMRGLSGKLDDTRPKDVRFVLDRVLSEKPGSKLLKGRVDVERAGVAGQCAGTTTVMTIVGGTINLPGRPKVSFTDKRVKACVLLGPQMAAAGSVGRALHKDSWSTITVPTLVVTGTEDFNWIAAVRSDPKMLRQAYDNHPPGDRYLVEIRDAEHNAFTDSVPYYPARKRDPRHHKWICEAATAFFNAYLREDAEALKWLKDEELEKATKKECRQEHDGSEPEKQEPPAKEEKKETPAVAERVERMFGRLDRDKDGALSKDEMPERLKRGFDNMDRDGDGKVSKEEMTEALERYDRRRGSRERPRREEKKEEEKPAAAGVGVAELVKLHDGKRDKDLQVRATWPEKEGTFPVIVFSHRVGGARSDYQPLVEHWVKSGYVVIQADHSDSRELEARGPRLDWVARARDMSFLIDSLAEIEKTAPGVKGRMDTKRIGAGGHLIGAYAASTLAGQKNFNAGSPDDLKDDRIKAALLMSPQGRGQRLTEKSWEKITGPMMVLSGSGIPSRRTGNPAEWRKEPFTFSPPGGKYLVWIEGLEGEYGALIIPGRGDNEEQAKWIKDVTLAFWDAHLKGDRNVVKRYLNTTILEKESGGKATITPKLGEEGSMVPSKENCEAAADYSAKNKGLAVLVMVGGEIVFERYDNGYSAEKHNHLHSATKAFWGVAAAAMVEDGLLKFDERACETLTEWKSDPGKSRITVRHLLELSAGLAQDIPALQGFNGTAKDKYAYAVGLKVLRVPGKKFQYGPSCYYVLGEIMKRKLKKDPLEYLKERILDPIGAKVADWKRDPSGNAHMPNGAYLTARDWAKYGQFLLQGCKWEGKQIVKKQLFEECLRPSKANPGHGLATWLNTVGGQAPARHQLKSGEKGGFIYPDGLPDIYAALGAGKNRMYMIPSLDMVVLRQGEGDTGRGFSDPEFLRLLLQ
ncbi:MAG: alpha/beta hydrolase [Planctomycetota bacterium]